MTFNPARGVGRVLAAAVVHGMGDARRQQHDVARVHLQRGSGSVLHDCGTAQQHVIRDLAVLRHRVIEPPRRAEVAARIEVAGDAVREAGYTERQVIEVALTVASITFTNLVNRINDTTLDFPAVA